MRKTLAIILSAAMVLSLIVVGASAAQLTARGDKITTAEQFMAMDPDGNYQLDADIVLTETYQAKFTGEIYGNGHTVTISKPMFEDFCGGMSDLTIQGTEIAIEGKDLGAVAYNCNGVEVDGAVEGGATFVNVTNNVNITAQQIYVKYTDDEQGTKTGTAGAEYTDLRHDDTMKDGIDRGGKFAGGFIGNASVYTQLVFVNCVNNGKITNNGVLPTPGGVKTSGAEYATECGGFVGVCGAVEFRFCTNNGDITVPSNRGTAGGLAGRAADGAVYGSANAYDCVNNGKITTGYDAGGLYGYLGSSGNVTIDGYNMIRCANYADITGGYRVGGLVGYSYATGSTQNAFWRIHSCVSVGDITAGRNYTTPEGKDQYTYAGLYIGYSNSVYNEFKNSIAIGEIKHSNATDEKADTNFFSVIVGCSSAKTYNMPIENLYILDNGTTKYYSYATASSNASQIIGLDWSTDSIKDALKDYNLDIKRIATADLATAVKNLNDTVNATALSDAEKDIFVLNNGEVKLDTDKWAARLATDTTTIYVEDTTAKVDTTTKPSDETTAKPNNETTAKPNTNETTAKPNNETNAPTTDAPKNEGSCGGFTSVAAVVALFVGGAAFIVVKKKF